MANPSYRATVSSIRTVYGKRLRWQDYRELMGMHSVSEVASYLKNTDAYGECLQNIEPSFVHRGYLETRLQRSIFEKDMHFCKIEQLQNTPFFRFFIMDYEIQELFKAIQLLPNYNGDYVSVMADWLAPYSSFSIHDLALAKTPEEILTVLVHTPYYSVLKDFFSNNNTQNEFTDCEIALRTCYLKKLRADAEKIVTKKSDLTALEDCIGEQIDLINLINAYRLKSGFHTDYQTLKSMMLPVQGKLPSRIIEQLYAANDENEFRQILKTTKYGRLLGNTVSFDHVQMENAFMRLRYRTAQNALHFSGHAAVSLYAVHYLFQVEVQNLITIIESIRYGKSVSFIQEHLVLDT